MDFASLLHSAPVRTTSAMIRKGAIMKGSRIKTGDRYTSQVIRKDSIEHKKRA